MTLAAWTVIFFAISALAILAAGYLLGRRAAKNDPAFIDRLAHKDHRIAELEKSVEHLKAQRRALAEQVRKYRDERRSSL